MNDEAFRYTVYSHARTYDCTTAAVSKVHFNFPTVDAAADYLDAQVSDGYFAKAKLTSSQDYYYLLPKAAEILRVASIKSKPLSGSPRFVAFATLNFCCGESVQRPKIPNHLFATRFPELFRHGPKVNYYTNGAQLGYIRAEHPDSMPADPFRLIQACRRDVTQRVWGSKGPGLPAFQRLVDDRRFVIAVLTPTRSRADFILEHLREKAEQYQAYHNHIESRQLGKATPKPQHTEFRAWHRRDKQRLSPLPPPPVEVHVIPELLDLFLPTASPSKSIATAAPPKKKRRRKKKKASTAATRRKMSSKVDKRHETGPFDFIASVHGCCDELEELLKELGYTASSENDSSFPTYRPPSGRKAIFLGNITGFGPRVLGTVRLISNMTSEGNAFCLAGIADAKLLIELKGLNHPPVPVRSLEATFKQIKSLPYNQRQPARNELMQFSEKLSSHLVLDEGKLVVAHAGLPEAMHGINSRDARHFAINGPRKILPNGVTWVTTYQGEAFVVFSDGPVEQPALDNNTINIDMGCVFGGHLAGYRIPEKECIAVKANAAYAQRNTKGNLSHGSK